MWGPDPTIVIVFGTLFLSFALALVYAFWYQQFKYKHKKRAAGRESAESIPVSELQELIRKATADATQPLADRLGALEAEIKSLQALLEHDDERLLAEHKDEPLIELPETAPVATSRAKSTGRAHVDEGHQNA